MKIRKTIITIFSEVLLCPKEELEIDAEMASLGVDSILANQIVGIINKKLGTTLNPINIFESITLTKFIQFIERKLPSNNKEIFKLEKDSGKTEENSLKDTDVVIVGMSARLPKSPTIDAYWNNLLTNENCITEGERWKDEASDIKGGFLENIADFDASFFRISPNEAKSMDPQQRILIETVQHTIDNANISVSELQNQNCGVFVTGLPGDYKFEMAKHPEQSFHTFSFLGNAYSSLAGRISYFFDFKGPSISIDTACSSSLTAVHQAYLNIQSNSCSAAIVGGVSVFSTPEIFNFSQQSNMASSIGKCQVFDDNADGFIPSEGAAAIILMKASEAKRLNLKIYGSIEAIECNHDGQSNGLMAPNSKSQEELITKIYKNNKIPLDDVALVESHGTGTKIGDPIEMKGLVGAFTNIDTSYECYLGASKSVIGHTLVCSGLASILKVLLAFQHETIPPAPAIGTKNKMIDFSNFKLNETAIPWPAEKNLAAVSTFGFTGSNSHLLLRKHTQSTDYNSETKTYAFYMAAHTKQSMKAVLKQYKTFVKELPETQLQILSEQLSPLKALFDYRIAIIAKSKSELEKALKEALQRFKKNANSFLVEKQSVTQLAESEQKIIQQWLKKENIRHQQAAFSYAPIALPEYPFDRKSYWITEKTANTLTSKKGSQDSLKVSILLKLKESVADLLGYEIEEIDGDKGLEVYGIDSLSAIKILNNFKELSPQLKPQDLFKFNSLHKLAEEISAGKKPLGDAIQLETKQEKQRESDFKSGKLLAEIKTSTEDQLHWFSTEEKANKILLLPPLNSNPNVWIQQLNFLIKNNYQVYIPLYPGHMNNSFSEMNITSTEIINEIVAFVIDTLVLENIPIVGWSLGGCFAMELAIKYPELVTSMVLISTAASFNQDVFSKTIALQDELESYKGYLDIIFQNKSAVIEKIGAHTNLGILKHYYDYLENFNISQNLSKIATHTLIIYGSEDSVIGEADIRNLETIPNHKTLKFENHGHFIPLTSPRKLNNEIMQFVRENNNQLAFME